MPITIVVADDYPDYRLLVRLLLASVSDTIAIVGEAADGEEPSPWCDANVPTS